MLQRTEGIVLRTNLFGEADLIVTHLTKDFGIVRSFAKSPRKIKSRFGSSLEPLTHSRISFWGREDASLPRLTQSDIIHPFSMLRDSLNCFLSISALVELTLSLVPERDSSRDVYSLLMSTLQVLEADCRSALIQPFYKLRLLKTVGYLPGFDVCGRCGRAGDTFHLEHGTVLCDKCSTGTSQRCRLSPETKSLYGHLLIWDIEKLRRIRPPERIVSELSTVLDDHVRYVAEKRLKSKEFPKA